ncbi:MAG: AAA family ATPase [Cocleimonas sp.]|nr:AAA family ATPase [Cocleimonas sp.]
MDEIMKFSHLEFKEVKGVGSIEVDFTPDKRVHAFIGENGVGKTKFLEALFQFYFYSNNNVWREVKNRFSDLSKFIDKLNEGSLVPLVLPEIIVDRYKIPNLRDSLNPKKKVYRENLIRSNFLGLKVYGGSIKKHTFPVVFISAQNRGFIKNTKKQLIPNIGNFKQRLKEYLKLQILEMEDDFSSLNMNTDIEQWFISIAQSSNPFQKKRDNREIEIHTVLELCHQIDKSIDPNFMAIGGDNRVFLKINNEETQLSHLSTGYASILKIIQSIVSGYGYFTNEQQLQHVRGIVLIDEIESHLHLSWQSKIIPTLKELFPNTTFYITTHSPIVLTQLENGEAYRLQREEDGVVRSALIKHPSNSTFVDMLDDAFGLDINEIKLQRISSDGQKKAKQHLLDFVNKQREASAK